MSIRAQAWSLASWLLDGVDMPTEQANPAEVAQELGISFDGEQDWTPGVPGNVYWAFTQRDRARPGAGITFYVKPGASREEIAQRWQEKKQQFNIAA